VQFFGARFGGVALFALGLVASLTISSAAAFMSCASWSVCCYFTDANLVIILSAMLELQTPACQRTGAASSGHPTSAGPPQIGALVRQFQANNLPLPSALAGRRREFAPVLANRHAGFLGAVCQS
jgi:hypothetical protein